MVEVGVLWNSALAALQLMLVGILNALRFDRCIIYFIEDSQILLNTGSCIAINLLVFGGSAYLHDTFLIPLVRTWLSDTGVTIFAAAYNILWLLPAFIISVLVSWAWCGEIAEMAVLVAQRRVQRQKAEEQGVAIPLLKQVVQVQKRYAQTVIAENIYKPLLLGVFFLQAVLMGHIPKIGFLLKLLFYSWYNALYCFDFKWSLHGVPLPRRFQYIEEFWAYFAGFGLVSVLPLSGISFYIGAAVAGAIYPFLIILACDANPQAAYNTSVQWHARRGKRVWYGRMPVFRVSAPVVNVLVAGTSLMVPEEHSAVKQKQGRTQSTRQTRPK